jgi:hypothetical protein
MRTPPTERSLATTAADAYSPSPPDSPGWEQDEDQEEVVLRTPPGLSLPTWPYNWKKDGLEKENTYNSETSDDCCSQLSTTDTMPFKVSLNHCEKVSLNLCEALPPDRLKSDAKPFEPIGSQVMKADAPPYEPVAMQTLKSEARPFTPFASQISSCMEEASGVVAAALMALLQSPHVLWADVQEGPLGGTTTLVAKISEECEAAIETVNAELLDLCKTELLRSAEVSSSVYILGYMAAPFKDLGPGDGHRAGFKARLGFVPASMDQGVCWDAYGKGFCPRLATCRWCHPQDSDTLEVLCHLK